MKLLAILGGWMVAMATGALLMWITVGAPEDKSVMFIIYYAFGGVELLVALMIYLFTKGVEAGKKGRR